jgi:endonuclease I
LIGLRTILNDTVVMNSYGDAIDILKETDRDPDRPDNIILVYTNQSVDHTWDGGTTWNREHVWPQSLLGVSTNSSSTHVGADLHNLKPADPSENGSRGNKYFDDYQSGSAYEPRDAVKGDIARILFYMVLMYDYLELVSQTPQSYQMAMLDVLIQWHEDDPVDAFESNRNDVIFDYQNNRNPLIDYPSFYDMIYAEHEVILNP